MIESLGAACSVRSIVGDFFPLKNNVMIPQQSERITIPHNERPVLTVVVDTEEEFDWSLPVDPSSTTVRHMREVERLQRVFDEYSIRPAYVVDYPVASQPDGFQPLKELLLDGRAVIGAHLHTWVSPPFEDRSVVPESFQGKLPRGLEAAKLRMLKEKITESFGSKPVVFKAGRYGIGPNTFEILEEEGFEVDLSPAPPHDFSGVGGPDFSRWTADPFWFGTSRPMLCLPRTGGFVGWLGGLSAPVYEFGLKVPRAHAPGILARCGAVDRLSLSPEGYTLRDMTRLARFLFARGLRFFTLSFHSPSCGIGFTPYVQSEADREAFVARIRGFVEFFLGELNGICESVPEIYQHILQVAPRGASARQPEQLLPSGPRFGTI